MSFIKNIEIWNNQRPRICNFDLLDYCYSGAAGNTCTENTNAPNTEELFTIARATYDAWKKAVNEYFLASFAFYFDYAFDDPNVSNVVIAEGLLNEKCNPMVNLTAMCDLYYGRPNGLLMQMIDFQSKRMQLYNSLLADGHPDKKTGIESYTENVPLGPRMASELYTYTVDYTNYQTPSYDTYLEYRTIMGKMMQQLKKIMVATSNSSLTPFTIPASCPGDVKIGTQTWTKCNLDVDTYRNGDPIPQVQDPTEWANLTTGAWCYYDNDPAYGEKLGKLYNWYAVNDPRGLAPVGYHIPTDDEWAILINYLGGDEEAGNLLKTPGSTTRNCVKPSTCKIWSSPNPDATNISFFTALPGGSRNYLGNYSNIGGNGYWWSSTEITTDNAWGRYLNYSGGSAYNINFNKKNGLSIRLIKN